MSTSNLAIKFTLKINTGKTCLIIQMTIPGNMLAFLKLSQRDQKNSESGVDQKILWNGCQSMSLVSGKWLIQIIGWQEIHQSFQSIKRSKSLYWKVKELVSNHMLIISWMLLQMRLQKNNSPLNNKSSEKYMVKINLIYFSYPGFWDF